MESSHYIVGVGGGSGAGKTYFINQLVKKIPNKHLCLISQDNYYKNIKYVPVDSNGVKNFDTLESIDLEAFISDLRKLQTGQKVVQKEYTFNNTAKIPKAIILHPAPVIIVEGVFVFAFEEIRKLLDLSIYIDSTEEIKFERRIRRDKVERGYDEADVTYRYENHVTPAFKRYIKPYKKVADHVIVNDGRVNEQIVFISELLKSHLIK